MASRNMAFLKRRKKHKINDQNRTLKQIAVVMVCIMTLLSLNVFVVSIFKVHVLSGRNLGPYSQSANIQTSTLKATRGYIYDANGEIIAQDIRTYNIVCILDPNRPSMEGTVAYVADKENTAAMLAPVLDMSEAEILSYLNQDVYQTELGAKGRNLSKETRDLIDSFNLPGIEFTDSITRSYPLGTFASNLIGFAQSDETGSTIGRMGLEYYLDEYLRGIDGSTSYQSDRNGFILPGMMVEETPAVNGYNVILTLEKTVQEALEEAFEQTMDDFDVSRVWGAVMEADTGRIVGWGQSPSFDPNLLDITEYNDYGSQLAYEAGSTIKSITWAAAIDTGNYDGTELVNSNDFYYLADAAGNPVRVNFNSGNRITNSRWREYGWIEYDYGLILSANTVAASLITDVMTPETFEQYLDAFGFFKPTGALGFNEAGGVKVYNWSTDKITNTYGQGSTYTTLQLLQAYSAIFTDGTMKLPYVIDRISDGYDDQDVLYQATPTITGTPIKESTALQMQQLLSRVVTDEQGTAKYYAIPECSVSGKTGTTQVIVDGSYESGYTINSVMLAFPAEDPQYMLYYAFEGPYDSDAHYKTDAVTTLLRKVAMYYNIIDDPQNPSGEQVDGQTTIDSGTSDSVSMYTMPECINHSLDYVSQAFENTGASVVVLGDGNTVIDQYPSSGSTVLTSTKVFLLTDTAGFTMPDMSGWSRKDVTSFWEVSGISVRMDGLGTVTAQSIAPGTPISKESELEVTFGSGDDTNE